MIVLKNILFIGGLVLVFSCGEFTKSDKLSEEYRIDNEAYWTEKDESRVYYLEVVALHKLDSFSNTFGNGSGNDLTLKIEALPSTIGTISINKDGIEFSNAEGVEITTEADSIITTLPLVLDRYGSSEMLYHNQLNWRVITRSGQHYLRVWDKKNPEVFSFKGFEKFELNPDFSINAKFSYFESEKTQLVKSEVDGQRNTSFIGQLSFDYNSEINTLDVGEDGFTMVADETSGDSTYGGGRYIYIDLPEEDGPVALDFNRLYNPPCAFNEYTTCLYPPRQNYLPFEVLAGESITQVNKKASLH